MWLVTFSKKLADASLILFLSSRSLDSWTWKPARFAFPFIDIRSSPLFNYLEKEKCASTLNRVRYLPISRTTCYTLRDWKPWTNKSLSIHISTSDFKKKRRFQIINNPGKKMLFLRFPIYAESLDKGIMKR